MVAAVGEAFDRTGTWATPRVAGIDQPIGAEHEVVDHVVRAYERMDDRKVSRSIEPKDAAVGSVPGAVAANTIKSPVTSDHDRYRGVNSVLSTQSRRGSRARDLD